MSKRILIKPLITEKSTKAADKLNKYTFVVDRHVNKLEIKQAVEAFYSVTVTDVNTLVVPARKKQMYRGGKTIVGRRAGFKKAIVTLPQGEYIDLYGASEEGAAE